MSDNLKDALFSLLRYRKENYSDEAWAHIEYLLDRRLDLIRRFEQNTNQLLALLDSGKK